MISLDCCFTWHRPELLECKTGLLHNDPTQEK
jgi:hypothetical protein